MSSDRVRATPARVPARRKRRLREPQSTMTIQFMVNGETVERTVEVRKTLADFLREDLGLTGTHLGCEHGVCGACTVLLDGRSVRSCLLLAVPADGAGGGRRWERGCEAPPVCVRRGDVCRGGGRGARGGRPGCEGARGRPEPRSDA